MNKKLKLQMLIVAFVLSLLSANGMKDQQPPSSTGTKARFKVRTAHPIHKKKSLPTQQSQVLRPQNYNPVPFQFKFFRELPIPHSNFMKEEKTHPTVMQESKIVIKQESYLYSQAYKIPPQLQNFEDDQRLDANKKRVMKTLSEELAPFIKIKKYLPNPNTVIAILSKDCLPTIKGIEKMLTACDWPNLIKLNLSSCKICDQGAARLALIIQRFQNLTVLNLGNNIIGIDGIKAFVRNLEYLKNLKKLDFSNNWMQIQGAIALSLTIGQLSSLANLRLDNNHIGDLGCCILAQVMPRLIKLSILNLGNNNIENEGAKAIASAIAEFKDLKKLYLSNNKIGDEGACAIIESIIKNCPNLKLAIDNNNISPERKTAIRKAASGTNIKLIL